MSYNSPKDSKRITTFDTTSNIFLSFSCLGRTILGSRLLYNKRYRTYNALRSDRRPNDRASGLVERIDERLQDLGIVHVGPQGNCYLLHLQFVFLLNNFVFFEENWENQTISLLPKNDPNSLAYACSKRKIRKDSSNSKEWMYWEISWKDSKILGFIKASWKLINFSSLPKLFLPNWVNFQNRNNNLLLKNDHLK